MQFKRIFKHLLSTDAQLRRAFPASTLAAIEKEITASEAAHAGQIRFAVEGALDGLPLFQGHSPRHRAIDLFSQLRVWDTEHNNGLLIYLLLGDRAVEIVADRGIMAKVGVSEWEKVCRQMEEDFRRSDFKAGAINGLQAVTRHMVAHFPADGRFGGNELSNSPVVLRGNQQWKQA